MHNVVHLWILVLEMHPATNTKRHFVDMLYASYALMHMSQILTETVVVVHLNVNKYC